MARSVTLVRVSLVLVTMLGLLALAGCPSSAPDSPADRPAMERSLTEEPSPSGESVAAEEKEEARAPAPRKKSELLVELPLDLCNTPDAMCLLPDGNIIVSVPNFNDQSQQPLFMKITPDNEAEPFLELPNHPETDKPIGPLGICVAPSGDLFFGDLQQGVQRKSRVMRIKMENGQPRELIAAIEGFTVANALLIRDGYLYVSETQMDPDAKPCISGVFRFKLDEIEDAILVLATPFADDPHLLGTMETFDEELPLGADGLAFDKQGNLYVGNFSDGTVHRFQFDDEGNVTSNEIFARADFMKSADGLFFDPVTDKIYVADSRSNAVQVVSLDGSVETLARNGVTDGLDGGMDQPCEVLLRGRELIVSNMDWPVPGGLNTQYDKPCTLSVIKLDE